MQKPSNGAYNPNEIGEMVKFFASKSGEKITGEVLGVAAGLFARIQLKYSPTRSIFKTLFELIKNYKSPCIYYKVTCYIFYKMRNSNNSKK